MVLRPRRKAAALNHLSRPHRFFPGPICLIVVFVVGLRRVKAGVLRRRVKAGAAALNRRAPPQPIIAESSPPSTLIPGRGRGGVVCSPSVVCGRTAAP